MSRSWFIASLVPVLALGAPSTWKPSLPAPGITSPGIKALNLDGLRLPKYYGGIAEKFVAKSNAGRQGASSALGSSAPASPSNGPAPSPRLGDSRTGPAHWKLFALSSAHSRSEPWDLNGESSRGEQSFHSPVEQGSFDTSRGDPSWGLRRGAESSDGGYEPSGEFPPIPSCGGGKPVVQVDLCSTLGAVDAHSFVAGRSLVRGIAGREDDHSFVGSLDGSEETSSKAAEQPGPWDHWTGTSSSKAAEQVVQESQSVLDDVAKPVGGLPGAGGKPDFPPGSSSPSASGSIGGKPGKHHAWGAAPSPPQVDLFSTLDAGSGSSVGAPVVSTAGKALSEYLHAGTVAQDTEVTLSLAVVRDLVEAAYIWSVLTDYLPVFDALSERRKQAEFPELVPSSSNAGAVPKSHAKRKGKKTMGQDDGQTQQQGTMAPPPAGTLDGQNVAQATFEKAERDLRLLAQQANLAACASRMLWTEVSIASGHMAASSDDSHDRDRAEDFVEQLLKGGESSSFLRNAASWYMAKNEGIFEKDSTVDVHNRAFLQWGLTALEAGQLELVRSSKYDSYDQANTWTMEGQGGTQKWKDSRGGSQQLWGNKSNKQDSQSPFSQFLLYKLDERSSRTPPEFAAKRNIWQVLRAQTGEGQGAKKPRPSVRDGARRCREFLFGEGVSDNVLAPSLGGSLFHGTAVKVDYDADLVLRHSFGSRRVWRRTHQRLQQLLTDFGTKSAWAAAETVEKTPWGRGPLALPTVAFNTNSDTLEKSQRLGALFSTVNDIVVFPSPESRRFAANKTSGGPRSAAESIRQEILRDYTASPFQVDLRLEPAFDIMRQPGLQDWRNDTKAVSKMLVHDQLVDIYPSFESTDGIINHLLSQKLSPNVRSFINLAKRWVKERFPQKDSSPLNGISVTMFCLRYLWQLLGRGLEHPRKGDVMDPTGKLGAAMKVHWVRGGGADRGARTQSRRGLILKPHGDVDAEFVLELFFGFLHFLVHEAEEWSRCREDLLDKPLSDDGDAYLDGAASTTTASSSVPKAAAGLHTSPQCPALRWYMVPGPTWVRQPQRAVEHKGKAGNKGRNQPRAMGSAPDDLPFAFLFESGPTVDNVSDPTEAFFADILPTQTTMSLGDTLRHVNVAAVEGPGVIRQIYMRDEHGEVKFAPRGAQTTEDLARVEYIRVQFEQHWRTIQPHQIDILPTYVVAVPQPPDRLVETRVDGRPLTLNIPVDNVPYREFHGCVVRPIGAKFPYGDDWTEVVFDMQEPVEVEILVDPEDLGNTARAGLGSASLAGKRVLLPPAVLRLRSQNDVVQAIQSGSSGRRAFPRCSNKACSAFLGCSTCRSREGCDSCFRKPCWQCDKFSRQQYREPDPHYYLERQRNVVKTGAPGGFSWESVYYPALESLANIAEGLWLGSYGGKAPFLSHHLTSKIAQTVDQDSVQLRNWNDHFRAVLVRQNVATGLFEGFGLQRLRTNPHHAWQEKKDQRDTVLTNWAARSACGLAPAKSLEDGEFPSMKNMPKKKNNTWEDFPHYPFFWDPDCEKKIREVSNAVREQERELPPAGERGSLAAALDSRKRGTPFSDAEIRSIDSAFVSPKHVVARMLNPPLVPESTTADFVRAARRLDVLADLSAAAAGGGGGRGAKMLSAGAVRSTIELHTVGALSRETASLFGASASSWIGGVSRERSDKNRRERLATDPRLQFWAEVARAVAVPGAAPLKTDFQLPKFGSSWGASTPTTSSEGSPPRTPPSFFEPRAAAAPWAIKSPTSSTEPTGVVTRPVPGEVIDVPAAKGEEEDQSMEEAEVAFRGVESAEGEAEKGGERREGSVAGTEESVDRAGSTSGEAEEGRRLEGESAVEIVDPEAAFSPKCERCDLSRSLCVGERCAVEAARPAEWHTSAFHLDGERHVVPRPLNLSGILQQHVLPQNVLPREFGA